MPAYKYTTIKGATRWYCSFHYRNWKGENERKKKMGFATRREALDWENTFINSQKQGPDILFSELYKKYMEDGEARLKPSSMYTKRKLLEDKILPYFKNMKVCDITALHIRNWQNTLINYRNENGNPYSPTYLRTIHAKLSAIMNYAVNYYNLEQNPCKKAGAMGTARSDEMSIWTRDQFECFIGHVIRPVYHCAFNVLFYGGLREGEMLALTARDIPRDRAIINIDKNFAAVNGQKLILTPKTDKSKRVVPIHDQLHQELISYIDSMNLGPNDRLFTFCRASLFEEFKKRTVEAGLPEIRIHDLRHSHVSMLIDMDVKPIQIAERVGHASVQTTLRVYAHLYPDREWNASEMINDLFKNDKRNAEK